MIFPRKTRKSSWHYISKSIANFDYSHWLDLIFSARKISKLSLVAFASLTKETRGSGTWASPRGTRPAPWSPCRVRSFRIQNRLTEARAISGCEIEREKKNTRVKRHAYSIVKRHVDEDQEFTNRTSFLRG